MVDYPSTGSILLTDTGANRTGTAVSTCIIVEVDGNAVGAIKSLSINEAREIAMIDELGTDGHIDSVPKRATDISGDCKRTRFDNLRMLAAFSRPYIHLAAQRIPFDIVIKDTFAGNDVNSVLVTTIKNVWCDSVKITYSSDDFVIVEDMSWKAEQIYSKIGSSNAVPGVAGSRQMKIRTPISQYELMADRGERRGALDGAGLLQATEAA
jgi:hypothetical protein